MVTYSPGTVITADVKISKSGQITLPAEIRREMGVSNGDIVTITRDASGEVRLKPAQRMTLDEIMKMAKPLPEGVDLAEILREARIVGAVREQYQDDEIHS